MKKNNYITENYVERLLNNKYTFFLDQKEYSLVSSKIKKNYYNIYKPYIDSEKVILYTDKIPKISLFEIKSYKELKHQDILGSILSLNISSNYLGDILISNNRYFFYIFDELKDFIKDNLIMIGNNKVSLEEYPIEYLENYEREYEKYEIIVSSNRIDNVLAKIVKTNRDRIIQKIKDKEIILNYEILDKPSYVLKENDIFSVRRVGKFKYIGIINHTKKDNLVISYLKYV